MSLGAAWTTQLENSSCVFKNAKLLKGNNSPFLLCLIFFKFQVEKPPQIAAHHPLAEPLLRASHAAAKAGGAWCLYSAGEFRIFFHVHLVIDRILFLHTKGPGAHPQAGRGGLSLHRTS